MPNEGLVDVQQHNLVDEDQQVHVTLVGDSTIDNRVWVNGFGKSYLATQLGIKPDTAAERVKKSHRIFGKPQLSVVENVMDMLPGYAVHDYTNDGFTTTDVLKGAYKDKVFGQGKFSLFPHQRFEPLEEGAESIKKSQHIIVSLGGNNFREFLMAASQRKGRDRINFIKNNFASVIVKACDEYVAILQRIRSLNKDAQIILMTQYYPSALQDNYKIYTLMKDVGQALDLGGESHNPMTVIQKLMEMLYVDVLGTIPRENIVVADVTSSLNPYDNSNHVSQIEPSGIGGKKIAQMLKYMMTSGKVASGQAYRFFPEFFASDEQDKHVEGTFFDQWVPGHPSDLKEGYSLEEEKVYRKYNADELDCAELKRRLDTALEKHDKSSSMYKAGLAVRAESNKLLRHLPERDMKQWKMSVVLAINVLETHNDSPEYPGAARLLRQNAERRVVGKTNKWVPLKAALIMLVGVALVILGLAGAGFTAGLSGGLVAAGAVLLVGGGFFGYYNKPKSPALASATLANEADKAGANPVPLTYK